MAQSSSLKAETTAMAGLERTMTRLEAEAGPLAVARVVRWFIESYTAPPPPDGAPNGQPRDDTKEPART